MEPRPGLAASIAAAQAWWKDAGVDLAYSDEPQTWLAPEAGDADTAPLPTPSPATEPERPAIGGAQARWPRDLASFHRWWLEEPSLDPFGLRGRVAPRGTANAALMVLVAMPEAEDDATLLSGPHGRLLANMVRAMGLAPEAVYFAAALPRHTPIADWAALAASGMGEVLRHHIALASPERVLVLGRDVLSLLGHDPAHSAPAVSEVSILSRTVPLLCSYAPGRLLDHPRLRKELWQRWLEWTDGASL